MTHGEHWSAICADIEGLTNELVPQIITDGTPGYQANARVSGPDDLVHVEEVTEFRYGSGPLRFTAYVATDSSRPDRSRVFVNAFPTCWEGATRVLRVDEVTVQDGDVEAVVRGRVSPDGGLLWFFDPHHFAAPERYAPASVQEFVLAGLAYLLKPASFDKVEVTEGDMLKMHRERLVEEDPTIDPETIKSVSISFEEAAFIFPQPDHPENAEFMTTIEQLDEFELLGFRISRVWATFARPEGAEPLRLPVYVSAHVLGDYRPKVGDRIEGVMWLQGRPMMNDPHSAT